MERQNLNVIRKSGFFTGDFPLLLRRWEHVQNEHAETEPFNIREFWKILFVIRGEGTHLIDGTSHRITPGTLCVVHPDSHTALRVGSGGPLTVLNICFLPSLLATELDIVTALQRFFTIFERRNIPRGELYQAQYVLHATRPIAALLRRMEREFEQERPDFRCMLKLQLQELLLSLARAGTRKLRATGETGIAAAVDRYLDAHYTEVIDHRALAAELGLSHNALCMNYRKARGRTITAALLARRINRARQLLTGSGRTVSEICYLAGFQDPSYFHRVFRRAVGVTPRRFRDERLTGPSNHQSSSSVPERSPSI